MQQAFRYWRAKAFCGRLSLCERASFWRRGRCDSAAHETPLKTLFRGAKGDHRSETIPVLRLLAIGLFLCAVALPLFAQEANEDREQLIFKRYVELLEKQPKLGTAFDRVYRHHVERGSVDVFLAPYRVKETGEAALLVGLVEAQRGREAEAAAAFLKAEKLRPNDPLPSFSLARVLVAEHDFAGAIAACERALSKQPARADLLEISQLLAQVQTRNGQRDDAIKTWRRVETQFGSDARTQERVARGFLDAGDVAGARQRFEKLAQQANDPTARVQFAIKAAELQLEAKERDGAIAALDRLLDGLKPDSWPARLVSQRIEEAFLREDDLKGLDAYYRARLKRLPNDVEAQLRFAKLLARQQRPDDAIAALRELLKRAPSQRTARQALIDLLANTQRWSEAASEHAELDRLAPGDADNLRAWGQIVLRDEARPLVDRRKEAEAIWRRLLEAKPKEAAAQVQVAEWLRSIERTDEAVALYRRAIELAPNETQYREALGEFLFAVDRKADAITTWREIATGSRKSVESLSRLGQLLKNHDDVGGAIAAYAAACDLEPRVADLLAHARLLRDTRKFDESLKQIEKASELAESAEDRQQVEAEEFATLQAADRIGPELQRLRALVFGSTSSKSGGTPTKSGGTSLSPQGEGRGANSDPKRPQSTTNNKTNSGDSNAATDPSRPSPEGSERATQTGFRVAEALRLARLSLFIERLDDALVAARAAVKSDESSNAARTLLATIAQQAKQWPEAAEQRQWLAEHDRRSESAHLSSLIEIERERQNYAGALKASERLVAIAPDHPDHRRVQSELLFELKRPNDGLAALREAARHSSDATSWSGLAAKLAQLERKDEAIETYWHAFSLAKSEDDRFAIVRALGKLTERQGASRRSVTNPPLAVAVPVNQEPAASALRLTEATQFARLVQRLERQRFEGQQDIPMRRCLVELHRSVGDNAAALERLKSLNADEPNNARTLQDLVAITQAMRDLKQAIEYQSQLVTLDPSTENERQLASLLLAAGEQAGHAELLRRLAARSMSPGERLQFVDDLVKSGQLKLAVELLEGDLQRQPNDWESRYRLAALHFQQGREAEAVKHFAMLRRLNVPRDQKAKLQLSAQTNVASMIPTGSLREELIERLKRGHSLIQGLQKFVNTRARLGSRTQAAIQTPTAIEWDAPPDFGSAATIALYVMSLNAPVSEDAKRSLAIEQREFADGGTKALPLLWDWIVVRDELDGIRLYDPQKGRGVEPTYPGPSVLSLVKELARREPIAGNLLLLIWLNHESRGIAGLEIRSSLGQTKADEANGDANSEVTTVEIRRQDEPRLLNLAPETLDILVAAFDRLHEQHGQHLRVDQEVAQLVMQLHQATRHEQAAKVLAQAVVTARTANDFAALLVATRKQTTRSSVLKAIRERLLGLSDQSASNRQMAFVPPSEFERILQRLDPFTELEQRRQLAEWYVRHCARVMPLPTSYPDWFLVATVSTPLDRPLPQHSKPSPFVIPPSYQAATVNSGERLKVRFLSHADPFSVLVGDRFLDVWGTEIVWPHLDRKLIAALLSDLERWSAASSGREREFFEVLRAQALERSGRHEESVLLLKALLDEEPTNFRRRIAVVAVLGEGGKSDEALRVLDAEALPVEGSMSEEEGKQASRVLYARERYALQLAERLKDRDRAAKAAGILAKAELASDVWYEVAQLCMATDFSGGVAPQLPAELRSNSATKTFLNESTPPVVEHGNRMLELPAALLIAREPEKSIAAAARVLKTLPASNPQLVPLFRYQPGYWERLKQLAMLLDSDAAQEMKVSSLLETMLFHNRWTEQTQYSRELQAMRAKYETESPQALVAAAKMKLNEAKHDDALDLFVRACKVRSESLEENLTDIEAAFMHSKRANEYSLLLTETDLRSLPKASRRAVDLARSRVVNGQGTLEALRLLRAGSTALPSYQQAALRHWDDKDASQHWPFFLVRHEDLFPVTETTEKRQWLGLDERTNDGTSRHVLAFEDIIPALSESKIRTALTEETARQRRRVPQWLAGEFYLAYFELHDNQFDAARSRLLKLAASPIPANVVGQMARLIARVQNAEAVAIAFISRLCDRVPESVQRLSDQPAWHLAWMHSKRGERQQIEAVLARAVAQQEQLIEAKLPQDERMQRRYQLWLSHIEVLQEFACSGESLRQLKRIHQHATSIKPSERPKVWDLAHPQIFHLERVRSALASASFEESSQFLADFVTVADEKQPESQSRVELLLDVTSPGLASSPLTSFFELCLEAASKLEDRERLNLLRERLNAASKSRPDLTIAIARTRLALLEAETPEARLPALIQLEEQWQRLPIAKPGKTSAELRELEDRIGFWLIARTIRSKDSGELQALRASFEAAALNAAGSHPREAWRETIQAEQRRGL